MHALAHREGIADSPRVSPDSRSGRRPAIRAPNLLWPMIARQVQRKCACGGGCPRCKMEPAVQTLSDAEFTDEVLTQYPSAPAAPTPVPAPWPAGPASAVSCKVVSGPSYSPSGTVPVTPSGRRKSALFHLAASFANTAANPARCCEVRQYIMWDEAFRQSHKGAPHRRFTQDDPGIFYEDLSARNNSRYGHRSGPYSAPTPGCKDEYKTGSKQDTANGDTYCGEDAPSAPAKTTGQFQFYLGVDDVCNENREVAATDPPLVLNW
jgi:hypothetical protein